MGFCKVKGEKGRKNLHVAIRCEFEPLECSLRFTFYVARYVSKLDRLAFPLSRLCRRLCLYFLMISVDYVERGVTRTRFRLQGRCKWVGCHLHD